MRHESASPEAASAAKQRGTKLGSSRPSHWDDREDLRLAGLQKARQASIEAKRQAARHAYTDVAPIIYELRQSGQSLRAIAQRLDMEGYATRRGKPWNPVQVGKVLEMAKKDRTEGPMSAKSN